MYENTLAKIIEVTSIGDWKGLFIERLADSGLPYITIDAIFGDRISVRCYNMELIGFCGKNRDCEAFNWWSFKKGQFTFYEVANLFQARLANVAQIHSDALRFSGPTIYFPITNRAPYAEIWDNMPNIETFLQSRIDNIKN
jgi:hypothetical protein